MAAYKPPPGKHASGKPPVDGEPPVPDGGDFFPVLAVEIPIKCHVISSGPQYPRSHSNENEICHLVVGDGKPSPPNIAPDQGQAHQYGDGVHKAVVANGEGADLNQNRVHSHLIQYRAFLRPTKKTPPGGWRGGSPASLTFVSRLFRLLMGSRSEFQKAYP